MEIHSSRHPSLPTNLPAATSTAPNTPLDRQTSEQTTQLPTKPNLRSVIKTILLKDYYKPTPSSSPACEVSPARPIMRMKESDDYITARAANPRTGLISPSVGTRTPCTEATPDSPGAALRLSKIVHASPTPLAVVRRPSRANQGRKISGGDIYKWPAQETLFIHRPSSTHSDDGVYSDRASLCSVPKDDQLLHMPSADEPQPFAYPGYSDEQIRAFEHYRHKARRTSNEGYDRRLVQPSAKLATPPGAFESYDILDDEQDLWTVHPAASQHFQPYRHRELREVAIQQQPYRIAVGKREHAGTAKHSHDIAQFARRMHDVGVEVKTPISGTTQYTASAFASPKTRTIKPVEDPRNVPQDGTDRSNILGQQEMCCLATAHIPRKAVGWAPRPAPVVRGDPFKEEHRKGSLPTKASYGDVEWSRNGELLVENLRMLPRVRPGRGIEPVVAERQCSFGCQQSTSDGQCLERRNVSSTSTVIRRKSYVDEEEPESTEPAEIALGIFYTFLAFVQSLRVPKSAQIETLMSPDASTKAKAEALKAVLSRAAHAVAVLTILAVCWRFGVAVLHCVEVVLWPLALPLRVLRWIARDD